MCTLPHHAGCSRDGADGTNRRDVLKSLTALGLTAPLATLILGAHRQSKIPRAS